MTKNGTHVRDEDVPLWNVLDLIEIAHQDLTTETAALDWNHPLARIRFDLFQVAGALEEYIKGGPPA